VRIVGYCRISKGDEERPGLSLDAQAEAIRSYCRLYQSEIGEADPEIIREIESAKNVTDRPRLREVLDRIRRGEVRHFICKHTSRWARNFMEAREMLALFEKYGCMFHSVDQRLDTGTATGRLLRDIFLSLDEHERGRISERTRDALRAGKKIETTQTPLHALRAARKMLEVGRAPYGYRFVGGKLVLEFNEQRIVARVHQLRAEGLTLQGIADCLLAEGLQPRKANGWSPGQLYRILKVPAA
jgi:site-specific DNA recombinase